MAIGEEVFTPSFNILAREDTYKLVVVAPVPATVNPPTIVVVTPTAPIWMPPRAVELVPINIVVVPGPVPIFTVDDVPIPSDNV